VIELQFRGLRARAQAPYAVRYKGRPIGEYFADLVVEECIVLEIKAQESLHPQHIAQLLNCLVIADLHLGCLSNFGTPQLGLRRVVR
jgi:GxxExxY protein